MKAAGVGETRIASRSFSQTAVFGFWEGLKSYSFIPWFRKQVIALLDDIRPDVFVPVSLSGLNLGLARYARKTGIKVVYLSPPQLWAWGKWRAKKLAQSTDLVICLLPFEEPFFRSLGVNAIFLGNPLVDAIPDSALRTPRSALRVALMPGSRRSEEARHRPLLEYVAEQLKREFPGLEAFELQYEYQPDSPARYARMAQADLIVAASGTAVLEAAILGVPVIVIYQLSVPTYLIARLLVGLKHVALPNLILGRQVVPELVQTGPEPILAQARVLLADPAERLRMRNDLAEVRRQLGPPGAAMRIARAILEASPGFGRRPRFRHRTGRRELRSLI